VHEPLQHSRKSLQEAPGERQHTDWPAHGTPLHVAPEPGQQPTTPQKLPASPQQLPRAHR